VFTGSPAHVSALSGPTARSASGRLPRGHRLEQRHSHPGFPLPFGRRHPLGGHPVPPRDSAPLTIGLPGPRTTRTPTGFPRSAHTRHDRGGCPLDPETSGVPTTDSHYPVAACRLFQRPGPITPVLIPSPRARNNEASPGIHSRSPVRSSPRPLLPRTERGPFGFFPGLRTPTDQTRRRTPERGSISNTDRELRTRHNRPPTCEFTRHTRPRVAREDFLFFGQVRPSAAAADRRTGPVLAPLRAAGPAAAHSKGPDDRERNFPSHRAPCNLIMLSWCVRAGLLRSRSSSRSPATGQGR
jgi:hypothetical protein